MATGRQLGGAKRETTGTTGAGGGSDGRSHGHPRVAALAASFGHPHLAIALTGASTASVVTIGGVDFAQAANAGLFWVGVAVSFGLLSFAIFVVLWLFLYRSLVKPERVNNNELQEIRDRMVDIESALATSVGHDLGTKEQEAKAETRGLLDNVELDLITESSFWVDGTAYLEAWARIHRAEEEVVMCGRLVQVRSVAVRDIDRLKGSQIPDAIDLQGRLKDALRELEPVIRAGNESGSAALSIARNDIRYVLNAVNEYREGQWRALVDFRDIVVTTAALLWITIYATLLVAIAAGASAQNLTAALMFFMAGSIAGFLSQMYGQSRSGSESSVEDFGLALARTIAMPVFSGAIALVGVVAVAALHLTVNGISFTPSTVPGAAVDWSSVFNWQDNGLGFGIAFIVALAPETLFDLLKNSKNIKIAISRSEATG